MLNSAKLYILDICSAKQKMHSEFIQNFTNLIFGLVLYQTPVSEYMYVNISSNMNR